MHRAIAECFAKPLGRICCDGSSTVDDFIDSASRHPNSVSEVSLGDTEGRHELFFENCSWMDCDFYCAHNSYPLLPVVIDDFHVFCIAVDPPEYDAPLLVDSDAVETFQVSLERFKVVARRSPQVVHICCGINEDDFVSSPSTDIRGDFATLS